MNSLQEFQNKESWFNGNKDAIDFFDRLVFVVHAWDDLIDKDKPADTNMMVANLFLYMPTNPLFRRFETELRAMFMTGMIGYMAANIMEKSGDSHRVELAHYLRYTIMNMIVFLIGVLNPPEKAAQILCDAAVNMVPERLEDYLKEHLYGK